MIYPQVHVFFIDHTPTKNCLYVQKIPLVALNFHHKDAARPTP